MQLYNRNFTRSFAYYRFHKRIGKGNWNRYVERYTKPRSIENTQRLIFNYKASYKAAKNSATYLWDLPKKIATSTSSNDLLDAWVYYRHKKKKLYHYILALKRLNEIKTLELSDWRFELLTSRMLNRSKYFIDLPNVCKYLGNLHAVVVLDKLSIRLSERINDYTPDQLAKIAYGFGCCRLHNKHLFSLIAKRFEENIYSAANNSLIDIVEAFGKCLVYNFGLFKSVSLEFQKRLRDYKPVNEANDSIISQSHSLINISAPIVISAATNRITFSDLVNLADAFSLLKLQDLTILDILSEKLIKKINMSTRDNVINPLMVTKCLRIYRNLKVNDVRVFESILDNVHNTPYNYPPSCISEICKDLASLLPKDEPHIKKIFLHLLEYLNNHLNAMKNESLSNLAAFAYKIGDCRAWKKEYLQKISDALIKNGFVDYSRYDVPKFMEILSMHSNINNESFQILCKGIYRIIDEFEPCDYMRTARVLRKLKKRDNLSNIKLVNMIAKNVTSRWEEFDIKQYHNIARDLILSGPLQSTIIRELWNHNRYNKGFTLKPGVEGNDTTIL